MPRGRVRRGRAGTFLVLTALAAGLWFADDAGLLRPGGQVGADAAGAGAAGAGTAIPRPGSAVELRVHSVHDGDTLRLAVAGPTAAGAGEWAAAVGREAELVAAGAAEAIAVEPNTAHFGSLRALEDAARADGTGMWGSC